MTIIQVYPSNQDTTWAERPLEEDNFKEDTSKQSIKFLHKLLSAYDVISRHVVAITQCPGRLNSSCCSSGLTQQL